MPAEDGGGRNFDRQALQATLADLVRAADESVDVAPDPAGDPGDAVEVPAPAPRPRIPTVRAPGQQVVADQAPQDPAAAVPMPRRPAPRPAPAAMPPDTAPHPSPATAQDVEPAPVPHPDGARPPMSGRPRLPFSPNQGPSPQGGPGGAVRPGSGGLGGGPAGGMIGSGVRAPSFGGGLGVGPNDDVVMGSAGINPSSGLPSLGSRISRDQGDNLARLAPTPTEQPTIPLRRRKPEAGAGGPAGREGAGPGHPAGPGGAGGSGGPGAGGAGVSGGHAGSAGPGGQPPQAARPQVAVEPWVPSYDDILPHRSARSGRSFRLRK